VLRFLRVFVPFLNLVWTPMVNFPQADSWLVTGPVPPYVHRVVSMILYFDSPRVFLPISFPFPLLVSLSFHPVPNPPHSVIPPSQISVIHRIPLCTLCFFLYTATPSFFDPHLFPKPSAYHVLPPDRPFQMLPSTDCTHLRRRIRASRFPPSSFLTLPRQSHILIDFLTSNGVLPFSFPPSLIPSKFCFFFSSR